MAADSALIKAALGEAVSRAGTQVPNLKPLYESNVKATKDILGLVSGAMKDYQVEKEKLRLGKNAQLADFKKIMDNNYAKIVEKEETMPQEIVNAVDNEIKRLQEEFELYNTYGKGDTEENERARTRITADLQRVISEAVDARATFQILSENKAAWHTNAIKRETIAPMMMMMDLDGMDKNDNVSVSFVDGKLTFRAINYIETDDGLGNIGYSGDVSYNLSQMKENLPTINAKKQSAVVDIYKTIVKQGSLDAESGKNMLNNEELLSNISSLIETKEDFRDLALTRIEGVNKESLVSALQNTDPNKGASISLELLESTFLTTFQLTDADNDGDIDLQDMNALTSPADKELFKENFDKMINVLTDVNDPNFDLERSKKVLTEHLRKDIKSRYEHAFDEQDSIEKSKVFGNYKVGRNGHLFNPAAGEDQYFGHALNKFGGVLYDDKAINDKIIAGQEFVDAFGNRYVVAKDRNDKKMNFYYIQDALTGDYVTTDLGTELIVNWEDARRYAVGKTEEQMKQQYELGS